MVWVPFATAQGQPAVLGQSGVSLELAALRQSRALIRFDLRSSAQPDGWGEGVPSSWLVIPDLIRDPCLLTIQLGLAGVVCQQAGGCPAASNFLLRRQKKVTKEKATRWSGSLRFATGNLRCSPKTGSSSNSPSAQTIARPDPFSAALLGPARRVGGTKRERMRNRGDDDALCASSSDNGAVIFARGRSTRGQMKSPSIAQRGEGGVRGGSGELDPTAQSKPGTERDAMEAAHSRRATPGLLARQAVRVIQHGSRIESGMTLRTDSAWAPSVS